MEKRDRVFYIISAIDKAVANAEAKRIDPHEKGGPPLDLFPVKLSPTGKLPATHYYASASIKNDFKPNLPTFLGKVGTSQYFLESDGYTREEVLNQLGLKFVDEEK